MVQLYEGLVRTTAQPVQILPCLALKWSVHENGKKWVFHLRKDVLFHNNEPFNAAAVVSAFQKRMQDKSGKYKSWQALFQYLTAVKAEAVDRVAFHLNHPFAPFLAALSEPIALIPAPAADLGDSFRPIGSGAFKFEEWKKGDSLTLSRNDAYRDGPVRLKRLIYKVIDNSSQRMNQIKNGTAHVVSIYSLGEQDQFLGNPEIHLLSAPSTKIHYLAFNTCKEPFSNVAVRRAFAYLFDKKVLVKFNLQDLADPALSLVPPQIRGFNNNLKEYQYSLEKAREELVKAGLSNGLTCTLLYTQTNPALHNILSTIAANGMKLGIRIKLEPLSFKDLVKRVNLQEHDLVVLGWGGGPDAFTYLWPLVSYPCATNRMNYRNPHVMELLTVARSAADEQSRVNAVADVLEILHNDLPCIPLYHVKNTAGYRKDIKNLYFDANGHIIFRNAAWETNEHE